MSHFRPLHIVFWLLLIALPLAGCGGEATRQTAPETESLWRIPPSAHPKTSGAARDELLVEDRGDRKPIQIGPAAHSPLAGVEAPANDQGQGEGQANEPGSVIEFNQAPLDEVVRVFADLLGATIVTPPQLRGSVTISSGRPIPRSGLLPLLGTILEMNSYALVRDGAGYRVTPLSGARKAPGSIMLGQGEGQAEAQSGYSFNIHYLRHIPATEAAKALKPFVSDGGSIVPVMPANLLLTAETAANQAKIAGLIRMLDVPAVNRVGIRLYPIRNVDVERLSTELQSIFAAMGISKTPSSGMWAQIIPLPQLSSIAVVSTYQHMFQRVSQWLEELDRQISDAETGIYVYYCQNGDATAIAEVLIGLFADESTPDQTTTREEPKTQLVEERQRLTSDYSRRGTNSRFMREQRTDQRETEQTVKPQEQARTLSRRLEKSVRIVVDKHTNSIVLRAPRRDLKYLLKTLYKLDVFPKQVLIEVLIAEVTLDDQLKLGVEWRYLNENDGESSDTQVTPDSDLLPASGLIYTITKTNELMFKLKALARKDKLQVISSPLLLAAENQNARILVGQEIPIVTDMTTSEDFSTTDGKKIVDRSIEYRDIGIILNVTPRINDSGVVRLTIRQEVSDVLTDSFGDTGSPAFSQRTATTNVVTTDGQSVVMAGLIQETKRLIDSGVPFLSDVPIVGYLFKTQNKENERTELILTITPHVIHDMRDAKEIIKTLREQRQGQPGPEVLQDGVGADRQEPRGAAEEPDGLGR